MMLMLILKVMLIYGTENKYFLEQTQNFQQTSRKWRKLNIYLYIITRMQEKVTTNVLKSRESSYTWHTINSVCIHQEIEITFSYILRLLTCFTLSITLREDDRSRVFEKRMLCWSFWTHFVSCTLVVSILGGGAFCRHLQPQGYSKLPLYCTRDQWNLFTNT